MSIESKEGYREQISDTIRVVKTGAMCEICGKAKAQGAALVPGTAPVPSCGPCAWLPMKEIMIKLQSKGWDE